MGKVKWYVEFSLNQNCFHIDTMEGIQEANLHLCKRNISNGYVIIAGPFDLETAERVCDDYAYLKKGKMDYATQD